jgi:ribokinase
VPAELLRLADPLLVNEHEAADLLRSGAGPSAPRADADTDGAGPHTVSAGPGTGEEVLAGGAALAAAILPLGPRSVVVTLGGSGAVLATADGVRTVGAPRVEVVDTTGAGDALAGALAWRLADGDDLEAALAVAVQVGSLAVTRAGAQASYPSATELERFGEPDRLGQTE